MQQLITTPNKIKCINLDWLSVYCLEPKGVVMNAADHPHGGGDGGRHGTGKPPRTPWGQLTLGYRTRTRKSTNKMIVRSRHEAKRKK